MTTNSRPSILKSDVRADFIAAIGRIKAGSPLHPELIQAVARGALKLNFSTVSLEARRARGLISKDNCMYPDIRELILVEMGKLKPKVASPKKQKLDELSQRVATLEADLRKSLEQQAEHFLARQRAEREATRWREAFQRLRNELSAQKKVVHLRRTED